MLFQVAEGGAGPATRRSSDVCAQAASRPSPRGTTSSSCPTAASTPKSAPIPALLAVSAVHHHLIREGTRTQRRPRRSRSGEPREVHHFALLIGYGAARSTRTSPSRRSTT
jgi:glutamate synthase (ferredoxin)